MGRTLWLSFAAAGLKCRAHAPSELIATCSTAGRVFITSHSKTAVA